MTSNTITPETAAVEAAETALEETITAVAEYEEQARAARVHVHQINARVQAGDTTITAQDMVNAEPEAVRLEALAAAAGTIIPGRHAALRTAKTAALVAELDGGAVRTRDGLAAYVEDIAAKMAESLLTVESEMEAENVAQLRIASALPDTDASGNAYAYRNGGHGSPIRVSTNETYEVAGETYTMSVDVERTLQRILTETGRVISARRAAANEPRRAAAQAERMEQYLEQEARRVEDMEFRNSGTSTRGRAVQTGGRPGALTFDR